MRGSWTGSVIETEKALKENGWKVTSEIVDINHHSEIQNIFEKHKIDIVVNAAGQARHSPAIETKLEDYDAVMNVNSKSAYFISTIAAKSMLDRDICGSIIHISSQMAHVGGIDRAVYSASKHAIEGMVKSMAIEWGPNGIRINSICPTLYVLHSQNQLFKIQIGLTGLKVRLNWDGLQRSLILWALFCTCHRSIIYGHGNINFS